MVLRVMRQQLEEKMRRRDSGSPRSLPPGRWAHERRRPVPPHRLDFERQSIGRLTRQFNTMTSMGRRALKRCPASA